MCLSIFLRVCVRCEGEERVLKRRRVGWVWCVIKQKEVGVKSFELFLRKNKCKGMLISLSIDISKIRWSVIIIVTFLSLIILYIPRRPNFRTCRVRSYTQYACFLYFSYTHKPKHKHARTCIHTYTHTELCLYIYIYSHHEIDAPIYIYGHACISW